MRCACPGERVGSRHSPVRHSMAQHGTASTARHSPRAPPLQWLTAPPAAPAQPPAEGGGRQAGGAVGPGWRRSYWQGRQPTRTHAPCTLLPPDCGCVQSASSSPPTYPPTHSTAPRPPACGPPTSGFCDSTLPKHTELALQRHPVISVLLPCSRKGRWKQERTSTAQHSGPVPSFPRCALPTNERAVLLHR